MNASDEKLHQRLDDMEIKLTFIDDAVQALIQVDAGQSQRIAALERALRELRGEIDSVRLGQSSDPHSEPPPPHY